MTSGSADGCGGLLPRLGLELCLLLGAGCAGNRPAYGGKTISATLILEDAGHPTEAAEAERSYRGWVLDLRGWTEIEARERLARFEELIRHGLAEDAAALRRDLLTDFDEKALHHLRRRQSEQRLPTRQLFLVAESGDRFVWKEFNPVTERPVVLPL